MAGEDKKQQMSISSPAKKKTSSARDKKKTARKSVPVAYHLFLYREEMRRLKQRPLKLSKAKYQLTTDLVVISWNDITSYSSEERDKLVQNIIYKKKLKNIIDKDSSAMKKSESL